VTKRRGERGKEERSATYEKVADRAGEEEAESGDTLQQRETLM